MTNSQSQRINTLKRAIAIRDAYEECQTDAENKTGFRLTKKQVWKKHFKGAPHYMSYYTFLSYINTENADEKIETIQTEIQKNMNQLPLFCAAFLLLFVSACGIPKGKLAEACAEAYPCKDSLAVSSHDETGIWEIPLDTVIFDTIIVVDCPPSDTASSRTDTVQIILPGKVVRVPYKITVPDSTWWRQDSALVESLRQQITVSNARARSLEAQLATQGATPTDTEGLPWWWLVFTALGGFLLRNFFSNKKKID